MSSSSPDPIMLQQILSRYENEEDDFLRELESMHPYANTDTSDDLHDESPVLGTLCSLVSEITELRKMYRLTDIQNKKLKRRLIESASLSPPARASNRGSSVVNRMSALFESKDRLLPRFRSGNNSTISSTTSSKSKRRDMEIRTGARERLSSPPRKIQDNLTMSSYSTDLSTDTFSSSTNHRYSRGFHQVAKKPPPLVLPELSDSEADHTEFIEGNNSDGNCLSPCLKLSGDKRASQVYSPCDKDGSSTSSFADAPDSMTASRISFLEFFGIRRKREKEHDYSSKKMTVKKRKKKPNEPSMYSAKYSHESDQQLNNNNNNDNESLIHLGGSTSNIIKGTAATRPNPDQIDLDGKHRPLGQLVDTSAVSTKHVSKSLKNVAAERQVKRRSQYFDENDNYEGYTKRYRPKSAIYLNPDEMLTKNGLKNKTKSCKSVSSRGTSASEDNHSNCTIEDDLQCLKNENSLLRNDIQMLKTRNNRLIDQFREKSMQLSRMTENVNDIQEKLSFFRQKWQLNDALDKLCLKDRLSMSSQAVMETVEEKLKEFDKKLQNCRSDAVENQKLALETAMKEQNAYQSQLDQIEQLQRENFCLLQMKAGNSDGHDKYIRQKLDLMPSYDAIYSFAVGLIRKLGQLRGMLLEKAATVNQNEFELMHAQSTLLISQAQAERLRYQIYALKKQKRPRRAASFHGEDLLDTMVKPHMNFYLPFREYGAKIRRQKRSQNNNIDTLAESNEQNIEMEFLRLFDYARILSKICEDTTSSAFSRDKMMNREKDTNGSSNLPRCANNSSNTQASATNERIGVQLRQTHSRDGHSNNQQTRRPISLVEIKDQKSSGNIRKFAEDMHRHQDGFGFFGNAQNLVKQTKSCSKTGHVKAIVSSLQDVSNANAKSPVTTPIMGRKLNNSFRKQRKLVKQSSLQNPIGHEEKEQHPIYDSPPRFSDFAEYSSIASQSSANSTTHCSNVKTQYFVDRRTSLQKKQMALPFTQPPQQSLSANSSPIIGNIHKRNPNYLQPRKPLPGSVTDSPYLNRAPQNNYQCGANQTPAASVRASTTSPLTPRRFLHYPNQPSNVLTSLQQVLYQYPPQHEQTIKEEDEPRSISISEASIATTIEKSSPADSSKTKSITQSTQSSSRLPKLSPQFDRAKKASTSWLSKLRINHRKSNH